MISCFKNKGMNTSPPSSLLRPLLCTMLLVFCFLMKASETLSAQGGVYDHANILRPDQLDTLNAKLSTYRKATFNEVVILIENNIGEEAILNYAKSQFQKRGLLDLKSGVGVLLLIVMESRTALIYTGQGLHGSLSEGICAQITSQIIDPSFLRQEYYAGINEALKAITGTLQGNYKLKPILNPEYSIKSFIVPILVFLVFIISTIYYSLRSERRIRVAMNVYNLSASDTRIVLGIDRPSEIMGGGWQDFKGGTASGQW